MLHVREKSIPDNLKTNNQRNAEKPLKTNPSSSTKSGDEQHANQTFSENKPPIKTYKPYFIDKSTTEGSIQNKFHNDNFDATNFKP